MDLSSLEIFRAVAAERSVTRAAVRLQRVQSNVTTRIRQLEEELGVALFLRDGKRMTLTERGHAYLAYAERLLALAEEARQAMKPGQPGGKLRLGSMESTAASRLPALLARYHGNWPEVTLEVRTGPTLSLMDAVSARRLDCALVARGRRFAAGDWVDDPLDAGLESRVAFEEELLLILPESHPPVSHPGEVSLRTLAGFASGCAYRSLAQSWLESARPGGAAPLGVQEVGSYHAILACVAAGACAAVMPRSVLDLQREPPRLRALALTRVETLLVWRGDYASAAFDAFRNLLTEGRDPVTLA
ncbi:LysR substrate-binding domain-containing protein [Pseudomonas sp. RIT-PI-AD]|uniref:LysR family transcriptional regulator n=1 Tax=Pseudomonas sp. RIT-PI-AD TaxID=3035294 RepID=UPI0021D93EEF|nr:LysR substrate-binding domain-containing protein [Pseudomonas sp. RIT-PI-AD]